MSARQNSTPEHTATSASRIAQQWGIDTLSALMSSATKRAAVAKKLGITPQQLQTGMQQLVGYTSHQLSIPVALTGVPRIGSDGTQNYGRPPAKSAPVKSSARKSSGNGRKSSGKSAPKRNRPTVAARNRNAKRSSGPSAGALKDSASVLSGVTTGDTQV